jgi:4-aminobutyrate aminotransferase-like enzyme
MALHAERLQLDRRVVEAKRLLAEALAEHQGQLTGVRAAEAERVVSYEALLAAFAQVRGGALFYPYLGSGLGRGALVELGDGSVKYDLISGIGVHHWGHGGGPLLESQVSAALSDVVMQGNLQQNLESAELSLALLGLASGGTGLVHCFLSSSGAMANENALKLVFHKRPGANRILAFEHCFAGRTVALAQITDKPAFRVGLPAVLAVDYVPFFDPRQAGASTARALAVVREHLARYPGQHAAMWCELVQGEGGFNVGDRAFFVALLTELRARQVAIVIDEVQTFGRTLRPLAYQHFGLEEFVDVVAVGKMLQVCATLFSAAYRPAPGLLSQTFTASTSAIQAGRAIVAELAGEAFFGPTGRNQRVHGQFAAGFEAIAARHPGWIRGPYGLGAMIAFTVFDGSEERVKVLLRELFGLGVIAFYCGSYPARVRFLPPIGALRDTDIGVVCGLLEEALVRTAAATGWEGAA